MGRINNRNICSCRSWSPLFCSIKFRISNREYRKLKLPQVTASLQINETSLERVRAELASLQLLNEKNKAEKEDFLKWEKEIKEKYATLDAQSSSIDKLMKRRTEALEKVMEQEKLLNQRTFQLQEPDKLLIAHHEVVINKRRD